MHGYGERVAARVDRRFDGGFAILVDINACRRLVHRGNISGLVGALLMIGPSEEGGNRCYNGVVCVYVEPGFLEDFFRPGTMDF